ncbi:citrate synthase [Thermosulfidibacter takaii ABI70S6]|uniref:Citrate synthase n=2 Tax=Thermosulfidibacter takaii (strain DSM 17441 / JCM 13301 / NBRC 103674 / ABI70S6) TaxID=1298851 RepID=CISY_THET7|nr:citrate (Si)-synthase [Thermosulfidibacter takaii]A0A0S3QTD0.1 RecName: Full=Citrate synthase; Short=CS [Thermosulfidibacter takaii ABI70S6]BAT71583.1 citrate synthase [Thermosulfidibacter takaii ABI70S6]
MKLKERLAELIPQWRAEVAEIRKKYGNRKTMDCTIGHAYGGMRGLKALVCDTSEVFPDEGVKFRGYTIPELREGPHKLPTAEGGFEPLPEGLWYLLLTGELPTEEDVKEISAEFTKRMQNVPQYVFDVLRAMPVDTHPMTMFAAGILAMQRESVFAKRYEEGMRREEHWEAMLEDSLNMLAALPVIAAYIYRRKYKGDTHIAPDPNLDWSANLAHMMGFDDFEVYELFRLYMFLHSDHEGGNVSAHTNLLVNSAYSDIYRSFSAAMNGLAGPLHGLANQEVLRWIQMLYKKFGGVPTKEQLERFAWDTLNSGQVIPGYGHAVLRVTDPRYVAQRDFALKHLPDDELFKIVSLCYEVIPEVLKKHGKAKNPWPNVDAHSGVLLWHYGIREYDFYTVLFGVSRALGCTAQAILVRGYMLPIERPKSITTRWVKEVAESLPVAGS